VAQPRPVPCTVLVHLNGKLVPHDQAAISPFDHGFLFGDGVYEGLRAFSHNGQTRIIGQDRHIRRFNLGLAACGINWDAAQMAALTRQLLEANNLAEAFVYWQVTRGTPDLSAGPTRSRVPKHINSAAAPLPPTVFGYCSPMPALNLTGGVPALKRASLEPDLRWHQGHIKSISLLGNVIAAINGARNHQADEALFIRTLRTASGTEQHLLTEGSYTNAVVVLGTGDSARWLTPSDASVSILAGVTRDLLLDLEPRLVKADITRDEVLSASEVLLVGTTTMVTTVTHLDGRQVAQTPGPVARHLHTVLCRAIAEHRDH